MKVRVIVDSLDVCPYLYEGSVLQEVKETKKYYKGIFSSFAGSYYITVPKDRCKKIENGND